MNRALAVLATLVAGGLSAMAATPALAATCGRAPAVVTEHAQGVTATGATLRGKVDARGCPSTYHFDYGPSITYGSSTAEAAAGSATTSVLLAADVAGLPPQTLMHVRIVATNAAGTTDGTDVLFKTKWTCAPGGARGPAVVTDPATVSGTSVTLRGKVNAHGCPTTYTFQYGTSSGYGATTPAIAAGSGTQSILATADLTGLLPNTVYHFRVVAASAVATSTGADFTLVTGAAPPPPPPPSVSVRGHRAPVRRGFVAVIRLICAHTVTPCHGRLGLFRGHTRLGSRAFSIPPGRPTAVRVHLDRAGRALARRRARLRVTLVVRGTPGMGPVRVVLIRRFRAR